ncbi:hypothetical protein ACFE04_014716 [Oxalis oulophora]
MKTTQPSCLESCRLALVGNSAQKVSFYCSSQNGGALVWSLGAAQPSRGRKQPEDSVKRELSRPVNISKAPTLLCNVCTVKTPLLAYNSFSGSCFVLNHCTAHMGHNIGSKESRPENRYQSGAMMKAQGLNECILRKLELSKQGS